MVLAVACMALGISEARGSDVFRKLAYKDALSTAAKESKLVFIDFYTTWCGPCKMMDRTTFKDSWVVKWLREQALALQVDAERDLELAEKFKVEFYPTLVFLNSAGKEIERLVGYIGPQDFRRAVQDLHKGITALDRARQQVKAEPENPHARLDLGSALASKEQPAEALRELLWCLDHGVEKDPAFAKDRDGRLLGELVALGGGYEPAYEELGRRRDAAERRLLDGKPQPGDPALYAAVCMAMMDTDRLLSTFDAVAARGVTQPAVRELVDHAFPVLLEEKRYETIAKAVDVSGRVEEILREGAAAVTEYKASAPDSDPEALALIRAQHVARAANYYQVLLGLGRVEEARKVAGEVLAFDSSDDSYHALAWEGFLSGKAISDCLDYANEALAKASPEEKANVIDTVARIMNALGKSAEALKLCEQGLADAKSDGDRYVLESCVADLRGSSGTP